MGHSAGGHLALLYTYKSAAGDKINGLDMHPISLVISEAGPIQFATNENELVYVDNYICAMAGISMPNINIDGEYVYNEKLAVLAAVSPYCVAQDFDENTTIPYTILAYGNIFDNGIATNNDGLVPIQPARDLDNLLNTNTSKCSLFELAHIPHSYFGIAVHPNTSNLSSRMHEYCKNMNHTNTNTLCKVCSDIFTTLLYDSKEIIDYYDKIDEKISQ